MFTPNTTDQRSAEDYIGIRKISTKIKSENIAKDLIAIDAEDIEEEVEPPPDTIEEKSNKNRIIDVEATYYTADCGGCIGITKSGVDVRDTVYHEGKRIIAVDPEVIPLGTKVVVRTDNEEEFEATAQDIGSAIKGKRIDILVETKTEANRLGRVEAEVEIIDEG